MKIPNIEALESKVEKRAKQRAVKRKPKMKVSGAGVKTLARIIKKKGDKS